MIFDCRINCNNRYFKGNYWSLTILLQKISLNKQYNGLAFVSYILLHFFAIPFKTTTGRKIEFYLMGEACGTLNSLILTWGGGILPYLILGWGGGRNGMALNNSMNHCIKQNMEFEFPASSITKKWRLNCRIRSGPFICISLDKNSNYRVLCYDTFYKGSRHVQLSGPDILQFLQKRLPSSIRNSKLIIIEAKTFLSCLIN